VFKCLVIVFKGLIDVLHVNEIRAVIAHELGLENAGYSIKSL
jgi:hypothetical protein